MLGNNKLRGSKRLKYFCQLCTKQCKDEHGWACHLKSISHIRKVEEFAQNPQATIERYSTLFEANIIQLLRDRHSGQSVRLADLLREFIDDRTYIDIQMTRWKDLDHFAEYLKTLPHIRTDGREVSWEQHQPIQAALDAKTSKIKSQKEREDEGDWRILQQRMRKAQEQQHVRDRHQTALEVVNEPLTGKIEFQLSKAQSKSIKRAPVGPTDELEPCAFQPVKTKCRNLEAIINGLKPQEQVQQKPGEQLEWILPGIVVKILPHEIDSKFHNKKGTIVKVDEPYVAELTCEGATLRVDQTYLETVVPKINNQVMVLVGKYKGQRAMLEKVVPGEGFALLFIDQVGIRLSCDQICRVA